jgi:AcrR family transcriptional regulator
MRRSDPVEHPRVQNPRQRALQAAHRLLETQGEEGLSLRAIAADMGAGTGSLYYYFANKDALLAELAADGFHELRRWFVAAGKNLGGRTPFHAYANAYVGFTRRRPALYALMYNERRLAHHEVVRIAEAEAFTAFKTGLGAFSLAPEQVEDVALTFWALGRGIASISATTKPASPGAAKAVVRRVLSGLETMIGEPVKMRGGPSPGED